MKQQTTFEREEWLCILAGLRAAVRHLDDAEALPVYPMDANRTKKVYIGKAKKEIADILEAVGNTKAEGYLQSDGSVGDEPDFRLSKLS